MKKCLGGVLAALSVLALGNTGARAAITIDLVQVGNPGNAADTTTYGAVSYDYAIATTEVNLFQYTEFLNAVAKTDTYSLYNTSMGTDASLAGITRTGSSGSYSYAVMGTGARPVTYVSWFDAARFANWVANGQLTGAQSSTTTEDGAYTLSGTMSGVGVTLNAVNPNTSAPTTYWIPSEDEWYKAAYYQPVAQGGDIDSYWFYPTGSDTIAGNTIGVADSANYNDGNYAMNQNSLPTYLTDGGAYTSVDSFYGTYDQGGNVFEWNDAVIAGSSRGLRGGSWGSYGSYLRSSTRYGFDVPTFEGGSVGFRVASVPEPSTAVLMVLGGMACLRGKRRRNTL